MNHIVIIGAGQAAAQAIVSLRQGGYEEAITLVGDEQELPYQRPPLSMRPDSPLVINSERMLPMQAARRSTPWASASVARE